LNVREDGKKEKRIEQQDTENTNRPWTWDIRRRWGNRIKKRKGKRILPRIPSYSSIFFLSDVLCPTSNVL